MKFFSVFIPLAQTWKNNKIEKKKILHLPQTNSNTWKPQDLGPSGQVWNPASVWFKKKKAVVLAVQMLMFSEYFCNANSKAGAPLEKKNLDHSLI